MPANPGAAAIPPGAQPEGIGQDAGDSDYLKTVHRGAILLELILIGCAALIAAAIAWTSFARPHARLHDVAPLVSALLSLLTLLAWWMISRPAPGPVDYDLPRRVLRWTLAIGAALALVGAARHYLSPVTTDAPTAAAGPADAVAASATLPPMTAWEQALAAASWGVWLAAFVSAMLVVSGIARSLARPRLARAALVLSWAGPALWAASTILTLLSIAARRRDMDAIAEALQKHTPLPRTDSASLWLSILLPALALVAAYALMLAVIDRFRAALRRGMTA